MFTPTSPISYELAIIILFLYKMGNKHAQMFLPFLVLATES